MVRINTKTGEIIEEKEFTGSNPEKQLQTYIEKYLLNILHCHFLKSLYKIPGGEIDTLAITEEGNPCIIEYKHRKEETIINQIVFYYDWLQERSTKYEFERIVKENEATSTIKIDWSKIRLVCIAKEYSKWDISLIKHLDSNIECYSYTYHKNELDIHPDPIINQNKRTRLGQNTTKEVSFEDHRNKADTKGKELLDLLRVEILELGDNVQEGYAPEYIKYYTDTTFLTIHVRKNWLILGLRIKDNKFTDPKGITKDISLRKWTITRELKFKNIDDINYIMSLVKQAYKN
ncbi:hypothetical protein H6504_01335 [Candidatus Woesearchaeota archaeon]|nr:hypothetical protein [Candidatus Woesearchaeota archaeon]